METIVQYSHATTSLALFALLVLVLNGLNGYRKGKAGMVPGAQPAPDYADPVYRTNRAYLNAAETLTVFTAVVVAAILVQAAEVWVDLLASVAVVARIAMAWVHVQGIGKAEGGLRSILFAVAWLLMGLLALIAIVAAFQSPAS